MLHEKPDLRPAVRAYPNGPGTTLVFATPDVEAAADWLQAKGVDVFRPPVNAAPPETLAFRDACGVVSEIRPASAARR